tara:strand:+ start:43320 stop:43883 length:564 start_codon:yes stop_codon:yes gene_type:complete
MAQLTLNIIEESEVQVIASSAFNFRVELVLQLGKNDLNDIFNISKDLAEIFDNNFLLNENNINKYFNSKTLPFIARYKGEVIGYIIGVPIEKFESESWARHDKNLKKNNTIYTYAYIMNKKYRKIGGYSKTLKKIYINWAKKKNYKYITGHVKQGLSKKFGKKIEIVKIFNNWYNSNTAFEYYRREL